MAAYTANTAKTITTSAGSADSVLLSDYGAVIQVVNQGLSNPVFVRTGPSVAGTTDPTVDGDNCIAVGAGATATLPYPTTASGLAGACVKTICAAAQKITVQVLAARAM